MTPPEGPPHVGKHASDRDVSRIGGFLERTLCAPVAGDEFVAEGRRCRLLRGGTSGTSGTPGSSGDFGSSGMASGGASGASGGPACAAQEAAASLTKRPVDIVFVIDNSGSMSGEITETQNQVNTNFAALIEASKIDYRVIMVTRHGQNSAQSVCISQPLSGTTCMPVPAQPVETAKFFQHSIEIASTDAWCRMLTSFGTADEFNLHPTGWGSLLRPTSFKVFVSISDDHISSSCNVGGANKTFNDGNNAAGRLHRCRRVRRGAPRALAGAVRHRGEAELPGPRPATCDTVQADPKAAIKVLFGCAPKGAN
jgi:hypothetical protein